MTECEELTARLCDRDAKAACAYAAAVTAESRESGRYYPYLDVFVALLGHKNSLVRNRAVSIIAANARWDTENRYDALLDELLAHVTDEKPITARQCIQALPEIAVAKPALIARIRAALQRADFSAYPDSMQPLLLKDCVSVLKKLTETENKI